MSSNRHNGHVSITSDRKWNCICNPNRFIFIFNRYLSRFDDIWVILFWNFFNAILESEMLKKSVIRFWFFCWIIIGKTGKVRLKDCGVDRDMSVAVKRSGPSGLSSFLYCLYAEFEPNDAYVPVNQLLFQFRTAVLVQQFLHRYVLDIWKVRT